jgi:hypothetical protein
MFILSKRKRFRGVVALPAKIVAAIWKELVRTLRGQYDLINGFSDVIVKGRLLFHENWYTDVFYSYNNGSVGWR